MKRSMAALAIVLGAGVAQAQEIPRYDPVGYCNRVAEVNNWSADMTAVCLRDQQRTYDKLKPVWSEISEMVRENCDRVAKSRGGGRGSYSMLENCVDAEFFSKKKSDNKGFKF